MSTQALGAAISGLRVAQKALDVTATNISNAGTEGYTRKTLEQSALYADNVGVGVRYGEVQRYVDMAIQRDYRTQLGVENFYSVRQSYLSRIMAFHGATDQESNIGAKMGKLYDSFVLLSAEPDSKSRQLSAVAEAQKLATSFNSYSTQLLGMRNEADVQIKSEVDSLNSALKNIAELNKKISGMINVGQSTADLEDQRDMAVKQVAEKLDVSYFIDGEGVLVMQTKGGQVLADTEARPVSFNQKSLTPQSTYPDGASGIVINEGKSSAFDLASISPGGKIGGLLSLRDKEIPSYMAQADELAHKMMMRFADQGLTLFVDENGVVPANDPSAYAGIAAQIRVNPFVIQDSSLLQQGTSGPPLNAGDSSLVLKIVEFTFGKNKDAAGTPNVGFNNTELGYARGLSINVVGDANASILDFSRAMLDSQGGDYNTVKSALTAESQYTAEVQKRLLDGSAVNTDEEMARMIEIQRAYSASAKMIGSLDELFRDLLNAI